MCAICKNQSTNLYFPTNCIHNQGSEFSSQQSSFSQLGNEFQIDFYDTHLKKKLRRDFKSPQFYKKVDFDQFSPKRGRMFANPSNQMYRKQEYPTMSVKKSQMEYLIAKNEELRNQVFQKQTKINELIYLNKKLEKQLQLNAIRNEKYIKELDKVIRQKQYNKQLAINSESYKIMVLQQQLNLLRNQLSKLNQQEKKQQKAKSKRINNLEKQLNQAYYKLHLKNQNEQKFIFKQKKKWKDNFIFAFLHMIDKIGYNQKFNIDPNAPIKRRVKMAWKHLKTFVYNHFIAKTFK